MNNYNRNTYGRLPKIRENLISLARSYGLKGDWRSDRLEPVGTYEQEQLIISLYLAACPRQATLCQKKSLSNWVRNIVTDSSLESCYRALGGAV